MDSKPTYQELEVQIEKLKGYNENGQLNSSIQNGDVYHSLIDNMSEGFAHCQMIYENDKPVDFIYLEVNDAFEKLTGFKNIAGKRISEVIPNHRIENSELFDLYSRVSQTGISEKIETFIESLELWFYISVYSSQKSQFLVVFNNITSRKQSEEVLRSSEAQFRGLFTQSHVGTVIAGLDKCIVKCNEAFCHFLGYSEKEIIGKTIAYLTYPEDLEVGMPEIKRMIKGDVEFAKVQKRYLRKDGLVVCGELTVSMVRSMDNKPLYFLSVIQDITERYRMDKVLKESEARFKQLIKNSFDMIILMDSNGVQHFISESCEKILGYKPEELIGIPVIEKMIHPEDQELTKKGLLDIIENKAKGGSQYRHLHKNGSWIYLEAYGNNQLDNPEIKSIVLNVRDITERKHAVQIIKENAIHLKELNATKDKLFSIIAHDLRSPFNGILGFSELLIGNIKDIEFAESEKYLDIINSSAQSTLILLDNLLNWAKLQTGQITFEPQKISLSSIIGETIELSKTVAIAKDISLSQNKPDNIDVYADKDMLETVLRNLISNAIKFTKPGGSISVLAKKKQSQVEIAISDNGVGMSEETIHKLFKIETNNTRIGTKDEKGSGLGLILCKELVEKIGGSIWVESELGMGSVFKFTLPTNTIYE